MSVLWTSPSGHQAVISPHGELDLATAPKVIAAVEEASRSDELEAIVIDLSAVTFMDSSGVKCIVAAANALRGRAGRVTICNASARVSRLLTMLGVDRAVALFTAPEPAALPLSDPVTQAG